MQKNLLVNDLNEMSKTIFEANHAVGWWQDQELADLFVTPPGSNHLKFTKESATLLGAKIALCHSELSEALEGMRKGLYDDHIQTRPMLEVELADTIIRILDICGALKLDIGGAVAEKFAYNQERADHKLENRAADGGKTI